MPSHTDHAKITGSDAFAVLRLLRGLGGELLLPAGHLLRVHPQDRPHDPQLADLVGVVEVAHRLGVDAIAVVGNDEHVIAPFVHVASRKTP